MKIVYANSGADLVLIKSLGFDTVLGSFTAEELDRCAMIPLKVISSSFVDHRTVIAYYLYDEPDVQKITIAEQEQKISEYREKTTLPLAIACIEELVPLCSQNFDWYLMDIYYSGKLRRWKNYANAAVMPHCLKLLYPRKKFTPIMGLYDDQGDFPFTEEQLPFARWFRSFFRTKNHAIFTWVGDPKSGTFGIKNRYIYFRWADELNHSTDCCWNIVSKLLTAVAWLLIKINPHLGKYKIVIGE